MGSIADKINYTRMAIDNIEKVLAENGYDMSQYSLGQFSELISQLVNDTGSGNKLPGYVKMIYPHTFGIESSATRRKVTQDITFNSKAIEKPRNFTHDIIFDVKLATIVQEKDDSNEEG